VSNFAALADRVFCKAVYEMAYNNLNEYQRAAVEDVFTSLLSSISQLKPRLELGNVSCQTNMLARACQSLPLSKSTREEQKIANTTISYSKSFLVI
jgi:hypothetical protein